MDIKEMKDICWGAISNCSNAQFHTKKLIANFFVQFVTEKGLACNDEIVFDATKICTFMDKPFEVRLTEIVYDKNARKRSSLSGITFKGIHNERMDNIEMALEYMPFADLQALFTRIGAEVR